MEDVIYIVALVEDPKSNLYSVQYQGNLKRLKDQDNLTMLTI
jgi:hypothetical protein